MTRDGFVTIAVGPDVVVPASAEEPPAPAGEPLLQVATLHRISVHESGFSAMRGKPIPACGSGRPRRAWVSGGVRSEDRRICKRRGVQKAWGRSRTINLSAVLSPVGSDRENENFVCGTSIGGRIASGGTPRRLVCRSIGFGLERSTFAWAPVGSDRKNE
jgi:hypothetical protein